MARRKAAAPEEQEAPAGPARTFADRRIAKRTFALHKGSAIVRSDQDPDTPPEAEVEFTARGVVRRIEHSFLANGTVEEATVLEVDGDTFEILGVTIHEPDPQLPGIDGEASEDPNHDPAEPTADLPPEFDDGGEGGPGSDLEPSA